MFETFDNRERFLRDLIGLHRHAGRDHGDLATVLAGMIVDAELANREFYVARAELALESLRSPDLRVILEEVRSVSITTARRLAVGAGVGLSEAQVDLFGSLLWESRTTGSPWDALSWLPR